MKRLTACLGVALVGCVGGSGPGNQSNGAQPPANPAQGTVPVEDRLRPAPTGVPHSDNLIEVALDDRGEAALSVDGIGGVRFWPALDGSREPALIRRSLANFDVVRRDKGWRAVGIDPAGSAVVLWIDKNGNATEMYATPPQPRAIDAVITADDKVAILGEDHVLRLVDNARVLGEFGERSFRPRHVVRHDDGALSLVATLAEGKETTVEIRRLTRSGQAAWKSADKDISFAIGASQSPSQLRMSPSGHSLALFAVTSGRWHLHTADLRNGSIASSKLENQQRQVPGGGFLDDQTFVAMGNGDMRTLAIGDKKHTLVQVHTGPANHLVPTSISARGGTVVAGAGSHLFTMKPASRTWAYLGYEPVQEGVQVISPSGKRVAWRDARGHLRIQDLEAQRTRSIPSTNGSPQWLSFYGEDRLIAFYYPMRYSMIDIASGEVVGETSAAFIGPEVVGNYMLLRNNAHLISLSKQGFKTVGWLTGLVTTSKMIRRQGEWMVLAMAKSDSKARLLSLEQMSTTVTSDQLKALPALDLKIAGQVDNLGRSYRNHGARPNRSDSAGKADVYYELPSKRGGNVLPPSPGGKRVAVTVSQDLYVFEGETGRRLWTRATTYPAVSWSNDSSRALVPAAGRRGFEVVDGKSGKTVASICGHSFKASPVPPQQRFNNHTRLPNVCSQ